MWTGALAVTAVTTEASADNAEPRRGVRLRTGGVSVTFPIEDAPRRRRPIERRLSMARKAHRAASAAENVLFDLGFPDADELSAKTMLAMKLNAILDLRVLTQMQAARRLGTWACRNRRSPTIGLRRWPARPAQARPHTERRLDP